MSNPTAPKGARSTRTKSTATVRNRAPLAPGRDNTGRAAGVAQVVSPTSVERHVSGNTIVAAGCDTHQGTPPALVTRRLWRRWAHRSTVFMAAPARVLDVLGGLGDEVERVYLVGARPGAGTAAGLRSWVHGELPPGWAHDARGHYMESASSPVLRYTRPGGARVEVHRAAGWFGEGTYSVADASDAYDATRALIEQRFDGATLVGTPATTGRVLFQQTIPRGHEFPVLSAELQELIRATAGQHRYGPSDDELAARGGTLPGLYEYDGRFMFAALAWGAPVGVPTRDTGDAFAGKARARYRVTFTVPREWSHLGILGVKEGSDNWHYPRAPGARHETWADGCAVELALQHGWSVVIHERIIWGTGKPLDEWAARLVKLRESVRGTDTVSALVRFALRHLVLTAIGAFSGRAAARTHWAPVGDRRPRGEGVTNVRAEGAFWVWAERGEQGWAELAHPEWSAHIWALAQRRLLDAPTGTAGVRAGALHVPYENVIALRADAVYLTAPAEWPDDGTAGRFRLVRAVREPLPTPSSHTELLRVRGK